MTDAILALALGALSLVGVVTVGRAIARYFFEPSVATYPPKPPVECVHEWEPWSEPRETAVKTSRTYFDMSGARTETVDDSMKKIQERVCAKCNIYERRWA